MLRGAADLARGPRALIYLAGGVAVCAAAATDLLPLARTPWAVAACLLLCAAVCGPEDGPWGAGVVLVLVGLGAWLAEQAWAPDRLTLDLGAGIGAGSGLALVVGLHARGRAVGVVGALAAVAATALVIGESAAYPALERPLTWGVLLLLVGSVNLLLWARDREVGVTGPRP